MDPRFHRRKYDPPEARYPDGHTSYPNWLAGLVKLVLAGMLVWAAKTLYDVDRMLTTTNIRLTRIERHLKLDPLTELPVGGPFAAHAEALEDP